MNPLLCSFRFTKWILKSTLVTLLYNEKYAQNLCCPSKWMKFYSSSLIYCFSNLNIFREITSSQRNGENPALYSFNLTKFSRNFSWITAFFVSIFVWNVSQLWIDEHFFLLHLFLVRSAACKCSARLLQLRNTREFERKKIRLTPRTNSSKSIELLNEKLPLLNRMDLKNSK